MIHRTTKYKERPPKSQNLFIKNCVCTLTCLIFSRLQSTLHLMQCTYRGVFSTAQNAFWTHQFWCLLVLLPFFVSPLPHRQNISLWKLFSSRKQTKKSLRYNWVNREGKIWESCCFLVKNCWLLSAVWASVLINHPSWNGQMYWKSLPPKNSLKQNAASHNTTSWYTDTDGFLGHSSSRWSLYYKGHTPR